MHPDFFLADATGRPARPQVQSLRWSTLPPLVTLFLPTSRAKTYRLIPFDTARAELTCGGQVPVNSAFHQVHYAGSATHATAAAKRQRPPFHPNLILALRLASDRG